VTTEIQGPAPFETRCPRCKVSFPIETRRCVHCGGATEVPPRGAAAAPAPPAGSRPGSGRLRARVQAQAQRVPAPPPQTQRVPAPSARLPLPTPQDEDDDELPGRSGFTRGAGLVWVVLAIAASLYRACTGEGP
jgi:hypothetical protein